MAGQWTNMLKSKWLKRIGGTLLAGTTVTTLAVSFAVTPAYATELTMHPPSYPWYHYKHRHSYDHTSLRRGYQVYKQVCSACHSMKFVSYRHLVNVCLTEDEAKAEAAEISVLDGPNEDGEMFERPGKVGDYLPKPYANEELARKANNGSLPPDFSYIVNAREEKENYIFQLLTSYCDPPAGRTIDEGQHYNPYFVGGAIGMARPLYNEMIEFDDGTPATTSQMAKDVVTFLAWASDPHLDFRKRIAYKTFAILTIMAGVIYYFRRLKFSYLKSMQYAFTSKRHKKEL